MEPKYLSFQRWLHTPCSSSDVRWARILRGKLPSDFCLEVQLRHEWLFLVPFFWMGSVIYNHPIDKQYTTYSPSLLGDIGGLHATYQSHLFFGNQSRDQPSAPTSMQVQEQAWVAWNPQGQWWIYEEDGPRHYPHDPGRHVMDGWWIRYPIPNHLFGWC